MKLTSEIIEKWNISGIADHLIESYKEKDWPVVIQQNPDIIAEALLEAGLDISNFYVISNDIELIEKWKGRGVPDKRIFQDLKGMKLYDKLYEIGALKKEVYEALKNPTPAVATNNTKTEDYVNYVKAGPDVSITVSENE